jgi:NAD(P)-dependent dehydrogenase (short-subunit alcohol dehydrogenase family)
MRNVIAVAPGLVDSEMTRGTKDEQCEPIVQRNALKRLVEVEDGADAVEFPLSHEAKKGSRARHARQRFCWEMWAEGRRSNDF